MKDYTTLGKKWDAQQHLNCWSPGIWKMSNRGVFDAVVLYMERRLEGKELEKTVNIQDKFAVLISNGVTICKG